MKKEKKKRKLPINGIIILIGLILIVLVVRLTFFTEDPQEPISQLSPDELNELLEESDTGNVENDEIISEEIELKGTESMSLLEILPYVSNDFAAAILPDPSTNRITVLVDLYSRDGKEEFNSWLSRYEYNPDEINFAFNEFYGVTAPENF